MDLHFGIGLLDLAGVKYRVVPELVSGHYYSSKLLKYIFSSSDLSCPGVLFTQTLKMYF